MLVPGVEECLSPSPRRFFRFRVSLSKPNDVRNIQLHPSFHTGTVYFIHKHLFNSCRLDLSDFQSSLKHLYISISSANSESCRGCSFCCKNFELFDNVITVGSGIACEEKSRVYDSRDHNDHVTKGQNSCSKSCNQCNFPNFILLSRNPSDFIAIQEFTLSILNAFKGEKRCRNGRYIDTSNC